MMISYTVWNDADKEHHILYYLLLTFIIISIDHHHHYHHVVFTSGPIGTVSPLHYDCYYNLLAQTVGKINYNTKLNNDVYVYHYGDDNDHSDDSDYDKK